MTKPPPDDQAAGDDSPPRRRTPTYMDAVRSNTPGGSPATGQDEPQQTSPRSGVGSRTRIGLPPVTILPGQVRSRQAQGHQGGGSSGGHQGGGDRSAASAALAPVQQQPRVLSRETVMLGSAPKPEGSASPQSLVVSSMRLDGQAALDRVVPVSRGRKTRPTVPAAEVVVTKHTVPGDRHWPLVVLGQRFPGQSASIRSLRHRLAERGDPRVVLVTSASRRDGKTFCAANLALALAEIRRSRVLLLETNVYHPSLASLFGVSKHQCFLEQLELHRRDFVAPWKVTELSTHSLHLLAINSRTEKIRPLEGALFTNCLDSLRGTYDYIIIDGPPISAGPDVSLQEDAVDGLIFTARTDHARARSLKYALDQVSPQDVLGVVLLDI